MAKERFIGNFVKDVHSEGGLVPLREIDLDQLAAVMTGWEVN